MVADLFFSVPRGISSRRTARCEHDKRVAPDWLVVDPNMALQWLVEAAEQLQAFSQYVLHDVRVTQM